MTKARAAVVIIGDAILIIVVAVLLEIDKIINGTLYDYGLVFSNDWAQPYWLMFRATLALIVVAVIIISIIEFPYPAFEEKTEEETLGKKTGEHTARQNLHR